MAVTGAGTGVWEWRRATGKLTLSGKAREICGFPGGGPITPRMVAGLVHPSDQAKVRKHIRRALDVTPENDSAFEYRIVTPAGEHRQIAVTGGAAFETVDGVTRATRFIGTLRNITGRHAAQAERAQSAVQLRLALEAGRMAAWHTDLGNNLDRS